jgi:hypothetical protein
MKPGVLYITAFSFDRHGHQPQRRSIMPLLSAVINQIYVGSFVLLSLDSGQAYSDFLQIV